MADIFLSYAREDRQRVRPLVTRLEEHGWDVWWDREIPPGQTWTEVLERALSETRAMVVVWTEASIEADWVEIEAAEGRERGGLVPVALDEVVPPLQFRLIQAADLTDWDGSPQHAQFQALVRQLEETLHRGAARAEDPAAVEPARPVRRMESRAPVLPSVLDYGVAAGGATWPGEPYTVAVAPGILDDGTFCVVAIHPSNPGREYLIEPQISTEAEAKRLADAYRERCSVPGLLIRDGSIRLLDRTYETPPFLDDMSKEELEADLRDHVKEGLAYVSEFKLKTLYKAPFAWSLAGCAIYLFDWSIAVPDWVPLAEQALGSNSLGRAELASVFPAVMAAKLLLERIRGRNSNTKNAIASEIVTTLACTKGWTADRFRELYTREMFSSRARGFIRWFAGLLRDNEIERFNAAIGEQSGPSPHDYQRETFERYIHAMLFQRRDDDYSDQTLGVDALLIAGDFQAPQLEHRLSFLGPREERELRYRVRTAAERALQKGFGFVRYLIAPTIIALLWSAWLSWPIGPALFGFNLLVSAGLALYLVRSARGPSAPPELFRHQVFVKSGMTHYVKLTRHVPYDARPVVAVEPVGSVETASGSEEPGEDDV